ncbi:glycoside hydrolase family 3 protein [Phytoactinopolyspora alkaliphila]|uniref:Glycoside hydrolase family 3 protein n=1 Tax=Phytoactinopolyspora alkaliphila TaxID=1783498 RepID=A0A6N9YGM9_9ACTN|nr:glycoside hydrolase family 3 protein [Phytoactinopolyspora alkaliphila]NED94068.1 glycoside hydrolase family 3 protein [Phytoactinopolyspora alkaliphila]
MPPTIPHAGELRRQALTTLFPGFEGTAAPPPWVLRLGAEGLGGVVLFGRNVDPARGDRGVGELTAALHDAGLLVAIDEEGGDVTRLDAARGSSLPGNAALGTVDDPALTEQVAAELGARLKSCGIDLNLAPVADVDTHAGNPVIGVRSFGSDPDLVARHVAAFVRGQQRHGVGATAKHFPGHGGTSEDSHLTVPVLGTGIDDIRRTDLPPFRSAVKADVKVVMTAHVRIPVLDPELPATLSPVVTGILRDELGFDGVVMTDGLDMHAISRTSGHVEAGVLALAAGVDALCVGGDTTGPELVEKMAQALVDAVLSGRLPAARLAEAASRVNQLRAWSRQLVPQVPASGAAAHAARRAVISRGDVLLTRPALVIELHDEPSLAAGDVPWGVGAPLTARLPGTVVVQMSANDADPATVIAQHPEARVVVCVRGVRRRPWQARLVAAVRRSRPDVIVVDHDSGTPGEVLGTHHVVAYGAARVTAEAAADILSGRGQAG